MGKSESTPSALWTIMPVMPKHHGGTAVALLRSALSRGPVVEIDTYLGSECAGADRTTAFHFQRAA